MRVTLARDARSRFSKTARSRPRPREARGNGAQVGGLEAVARGGLPDDLTEGAPEAADAREPDLQADLAHAKLGLSEHEHRPLDPPALEVAVRRLAERGPEGADEVGLGYVRDPGERRDAEQLRVVAVHRVASAQHAAVRVLDGPQTSLTPKWTWLK